MYVTYVGFAKKMNLFGKEGVDEKKVKKKKKIVRKFEESKRKKLQWIKRDKNKKKTWKGLFFKVKQKENE